MGCSGLYACSYDVELMISYFILSDGDFDFLEDIYNVMVNSVTVCSSAYHYQILLEEK